MTNVNTASRPSSARVREHEHAWIVESSHATSLGRVLYVRCGECGTRRVDMQDNEDRPPAALSAEVSFGRGIL